MKEALTPPNTNQGLCSAVKLAANPPKITIVSIYTCGLRIVKAQQANIIALKLLL